MWLRRDHSVADSEDLRDRLSTAIAPYLKLLVDFVEDRMSAEDFEKAYFDIYLHDDSDFADDVFAIVDGFFADVDSLVMDSESREETFREIGPDELREQAQVLLHKAGYDVGTAHPA